MEVLRTNGAQTHRGRACRRHGIESATVWRKWDYLTPFAHNKGRPTKGSSWPRGWGDERRNHALGGAAAVAGATPQPAGRASVKITSDCPRRLLTCAAVGGLLLAPVRRPPPPHHRPPHLGAPPAALRSIRARAPLHVAAQTPGKGATGLKCKRAQSRPPLPHACSACSKHATVGVDEEARSQASMRTGPHPHSQKDRTNVRSAYAQRHDRHAPVAPAVQQPHQSSPTGPRRHQLRTGGVRAAG